MKLYKIPGSGEDHINSNNRLLNPFQISLQVKGYLAKKEQRHNFTIFLLFCPFLFIFQWKWKWKCLKISLSKYRSVNSVECTMERKNVFHSIAFQCKSFIVRAHNPPRLASSYGKPNKIQNCFSITLSSSSSSSSTL